MSGDIDKTIKTIDAAAFEPELVPAMMQRVAQLCGGELAIAFNTDPGKPDLLGDDRAAEMQRDYLAGGWKEVDIATQAIRRLPRGGVRPVQEVVGLSTIQKHPFFQEYLARHGGHWGVGWHVSTSHQNDVISIAGFQPFEREQIALLQRLAPQIDGSLLTASLIYSARALGAAQGMELAGRRSILLDARGCVVYVSPTAEELFDAEFGIVERRLRASDPSSVRQLARLEFCAQDRFSSAPCRALVRKTGSSPIAIVGKRLSGAGLDIFHGARMLLSLTDIKSRAQPSVAVLRELYGLTHQEARVASSFAGGATPQDIAIALSLRVSTVRQHLKAVLAKTETHRQAELALLLAALPDDPVGSDRG